LKSVLFFFLLALPWLNPFSRMPTPVMIPWLVTLACVGAALCASPVALRVNHVSRKILVFFALVALYLVLHTLRSGSYSATLAGLIAWFCVLVMAYVGASLPATGSTPSYVRALAALWLGLALASVLMALLQFLKMEYLFDPWISQSGIGVAFANLRQRNLFATLCSMGLLALLYLRQSGTPTGQLRESATGAYWQAAWPWLAIVTLAIGSGLSGSRTGALQWLLIAALVVCWRASLQSSVRVLGYGALAIYAVVTLLMPWFADAVGNTNSGMWGRAQEGAVGMSRLRLYSNVLDMIAKKPLLGWGWQELSYAQYMTHFDVRLNEVLDNAHNLPLHLAVELGVPFALVFCAVVVVGILRSAPWREQDAARQLAWGVLMLVSVHSLLEYPLWHGPFLMTLGLCIGLLQAQATRQTVLPSPSKNAREITVFIAVLIMATTVYVGYDYHRMSQVFLSKEQRSSMYREKTWSQANKSWLFQRKVRFFELTNTPITAETAPHVLALASDLIHYAPEPRVMQALIASASLLGREDLVALHLARYRESYPKEFEAWTTVK
jgi:Virulence factor membrane-bound polymerase, C-terminal/O-Antigen ligase/Protein glycosylation ligase